MTFLLDTSFADCRLFSIFFVVTSLISRFYIFIVGLRSFSLTLLEFIKSWILAFGIICFHILISCKSYPQILPALNFMLITQSFTPAKFFIEVPLINFLLSFSHEFCLLFILFLLLVCTIYCLGNESSTSHWKLLEHLLSHLLRGKLECTWWVVNPFNFMIWKLSSNVCSNILVTHIICSVQIHSIREDVCSLSNSNWLLKSFQRCYSLVQLIYLWWRNLIYFFTKPFLSCLDPLNLSLNFVNLRRRWAKFHCIVGLIRIHSIIHIDFSNLCLWTCSLNRVYTKSSRSLHSFIIFR